MKKNTIFGKVKVIPKNDEEAEKAKVKITGWDFARLICTKDEKERRKLEPYINTSKYSQFLINQALCQDIEVKYPKKFIIEGWRFIKDINIMTLDNRAHFELLFNMIPQNPGYLKNRYKMLKDDEKDKIKALKWKFTEKDEVIHQYQKLISRDEMDDILEEYKMYIKTTK